ncbi:hypothetical protein V4F39_04505 [Aquincola sp. MAHUQ-54]|uniref:DUF11 domain-containing protein n=1 Tax=Aquincola agrisoli TaxID=3119538 RepID=A0AAW9Q9X4_9BURK
MGLGFLRSLCRRAAPLLALLLAMAALAPAPALACADGGCVSAGPRLASVGSSRGALLNALVNQLTGSSLNLTVADWNSVAAGDVSLLRLLNALQARLGVSSPATALTTNASLADVVAAAATAATGENRTALAAALGPLQSGLGLAAGSIRLGDLLVTDGGLGETRINTLSLVTGAVQLYNRRNVATTSAPVTVSGADLGLGSVLQQVKLQAQVVEPPVYVCGPAGSSFHTATMRIKLDIDLVSLNVNTGVLTALVGISSATLQLAHLDLYLEVARANGIIAAVDAVSGALSVQATPGVADVYLGLIDDALFYNRARAINPATDLKPAVIGALKINALPAVAVTARAAARGQAPSASMLSFNGPYPQTRTAYTQAGFVNTLLATLGGSLQIGVVPSLGLLDAAVLPVLNLLLQGVVSPLVGTLLSGLVDPLLELLGVRLGEVDVTAGGSFRVCGLSGSVYGDSNHNARRDVAEAGTGLALYAKLVPAATPAGPALAVAAVDAATGLYSFTKVGVGHYLVVVNGSNAPAAVTPAAPAGWIGTEAPTLSRGVVLSADVSGQHFGLFHGSTVAGRVFQDTGAGGGTPHNAQRDGTEAGLPGRVLRLLDGTGTVEIDRTATADQGAYTLWIPAAAAGAVIVAQAGLEGAQADGASWISVGGSAGTTGGSYSLVADRTSFGAAAGQRYTGVDFADVPANRFDTEGQQAALPGTVVFYPHRFTAGSAGVLTLSAAGPAGGTWGVVLYDDTDCNGRLDAGEPAVAAPRAVVAAQAVCIVAKVAVPAEASWGSQYPLAVAARLAYANHTLVGEHTRTDVTVVGDDSDAGLRLAKQVDKATAVQGDALVYTIAYSNQGSAALTALRIHDRTPAYTVFVSADCGTPPPGGPACSVAAQPAAGAAGPVEWRFTGPLAPGGAGWVRMVVQLQ